MAANQTVETKEPVGAYLKRIADEKRRKDCSAIIDLIADHVSIEPKMWGPGIVGFGSYHYKYESGREGDAPLAALASRANSIVLYFADDGQRAELLKKFGKFKMSGGCIHIKKLDDIDKGILLKMAKNSIKYCKKKYPAL